MKIKGIVFDLDGTLLDTLNDLVFSMNKMLAHWNFPLITREKALKLIGYGAEEFAKGCLPKGFEYKPEEHLEKYKEVLSEDGLTHTKIFDGIEKLIHTLKQNGVKLAVLSNKPHFATITAVNTFFKTGTFEFIHGVDTGEKPKPDATVLNKIIEQWGFDKSQVVMVGDGEADFLVGKNAGIKVVSALWGYREKAELQKFGANLFAKNADEVLEYIK